MPQAKLEEKPKVQKPIEMTTIYIMGKAAEVPASATIMQAMEYAGYRLIRGCGCRGGVCGACATVFRTAGDYRLKNGLACQTMVEPGMYLAQIPFYPAVRADYRIESLKAEGETIRRLYPEILKCMGCNSCTSICPQDLKVMSYISDLIRGDIASAAEKSFECIMCGLCASRCPGQLVQYNAGILARRLYGAHLAPKAAHLGSRVAEIMSGKFNSGLDELKKLSVEELKKRYKARDIEK